MGFRAGDFCGGISAVGSLREGMLRVCGVSGEGTLERELLGSVAECTRSSGV